MGVRSKKCLREYQKNNQGEPQYIRCEKVKGNGEERRLGSKKGGSAWGRRGGSD